MKTCFLAHMQGAITACLLSVTLVACTVPSSTTTKTKNTTSVPPVASLSAGEILQVLRALHEGEVEQAQLVPQRTDNRTLRDAAERIIEDHSRYNQRVAVMARPESAWALAPSALSDSLGTHINKNSNELAAVSDAQFDCLFLAKQVKQHQLAVDVLRTVLLPDAQDEEVRALLTSLTPALQYHLRAAQKAHQNMPGCSDSGIL